MADDELVAYDQGTGELRSNPRSFDGRGMEVLSIVWRAGIDAGATVGPGTELADVQWDDNSREPIIAPDNCSGRIDSVNRDIMFENLPFEPSQWLLIVSSG